ncbi:eukaryotic translation initiation factor 2 subunit 1 [Aplysia californica]|uniref:Eukaryotic translation initiation factor 2 subunit 1 n=1 Tax=Aplysia californica TaxID=6500 RepID=A0ABM0K2B2_APLCA|nr:eukaryotic translation initiation factor 2 subunit 1 [Aplysia californica]
MSWNPEQRFYSQPLPAVGEFVKVRVTRVTSLGVYTELLEYGGQEGMIVSSELAKTFFRSVHQLVRTGKALCCKVIRVNEKKKYIDLSKKRVTPEDDEACHARYTRGKLVQSLVLRTCQRLDIQDAGSVLGMFEKTAWLLDTMAGRETAALDVFKDAVRTPSVLDQCPVSPEEREALLETIRSRLKEPQLHLCAVIAVTCWGPEGVDAVKDALKHGGQEGADDTGAKVKILYKEAPYYNIFLETVARKRADGVATIEAAIAAVRNRILQYDGGGFRLVTKPTELRKTRHCAELPGEEEVTYDEGFSSDDSEDDETSCSVEEVRGEESDELARKAEQSLADTDVLRLLISGEDSGIVQDGQ